MSVKEKRKKVTEYILTHIANILPGDTANVEITRARLEKMTDEEFDKRMRSFKRPTTPEERDAQETLSFYSPPFAKQKLMFDDLLKAADSLKHKFFERVWLTDPQTGVIYLTPQEYMVLDMIVRRQAQMLQKKSSIPEDARRIDEMSGQVTGTSKGSKISFPETQAQLTQGLEQTLIEEIKVRGGDQKAFNEFERQLIETGEADLDEVTSGGTLTTSTTNMAILLRYGMMLDNNFDEV